MPVLIALSAVPTAGVAQSGTGLDRDVAAMQEELDGARRRGLHLVAPRQLERATERLEEARQRLARGDSAAEIRQRLLEARSSLAEAESIFESAEPTLEAALASRARALKWNAPREAADAWTAAERELFEAGRRLARQDREVARAHTDRAVRLYDRAAAEAERAERLTGALTARAAARAAGAPERAPEAWAAAEAALRDAESLLARRAGDSEVAERDRRAAGSFQRAERAAALADSLVIGAIPAERLLARRETDLLHLAELLGLEEHPGDSADRLAVRVAEALEAALDERRRLADRLTVESRRVDELEQRVSDLEESLDATERRERDALNELGMIRDRERRLREIQALFSGDEAEVTSQGRQVTLRLFGLAFEPGSSDLAPEHDAFLTKVLRAIREFERATVRIEGHTDSRGNPQNNRALSHRRAIAVREYVLSRLPISASRVSASGFGADRPVAPNDTEEGRRRNRRIEVVIDSG